MQWYDFLIISVSFVVVIIYVVWQWRTLSWWTLAIESVATHAAEESAEAPTLPSVTLLIPARNEAANLPRLLNDLLAQDALDLADKIVVINDHSTDSTASIVNSFGGKVQLLELSDYLAGREVIAHKKAALTYGISRANHNWIVTTDADCRWPPTALGEIKKSIQQGHEFISGPVLIAPVKGQLTGFQALDLLAYMSLTAAYAYVGRPILANGAHLTFSKSLFLDVDGYQDIDHLASGDDVLLLQKVQQQRPRTRFHFITSPAAVVTTLPMFKFSDFWSQRLRWANKTGAYTSQDLWLAQLFSFATSLVLLCLLLLGFWSSMYWLCCLILWAFKAGIDFLVLRSSKAHFGAAHLLNYYPLAALVHPFYLVAIGGAALLGTRVGWKGRS